MNASGKIALLVLGILTVIALCCCYGIKIIKRFVVAMRQAKAAEVASV